MNLGPVGVGGWASKEVKGLNEKKKKKKKPCLPLWEGKRPGREGRGPGGRRMVRVGTGWDSAYLF